MVETFIRLSGKALEQTRRAARLIQEAGGRPRLTYPPGVIIASIPYDQIGTLAQKTEIASIDFKEIEEERISGADNDIAFAMSAWNRHLRRRLIHRPRLVARASEKRGRWKAAAEVFDGQRPGIANRKEFD